MKKLFVVLFSLVLFASTTYAMDVCLQWDANTESDLAGYKIYYDTDSGDPYGGTGGKLQDGTLATSPITMTLEQDENPDQAVVEFTVYGLAGDVNNFFAVTAFDTQGLESDYSNEVNTDDEFPGTPGLGIKSITMTQTQTIVIE